MKGYTSLDIDYLGIIVIWRWRIFPYLCCHSLWSVEETAKIFSLSIDIVKFIMDDFGKSETVYEARLSTERILLLRDRVIK